MQDSSRVRMGHSARVSPFESKRERIGEKAGTGTVRPSTLPRPEAPSPTSHYVASRPLTTVWLMLEPDRTRIRRGPNTQAYSLKPRHRLVISATPRSTRRTKAPPPWFPGTAPLWQCRFIYLLAGASAMADTGPGGGLCPLNEWTRNRDAHRRSWPQ